MGSIPSQYQTEGYGTVYGDAEAQQAIAIAEVNNLIGTGGGPGGGGITQAQVQEAIESASNLDGIESGLTSVSDRLPSTLGQQTSANSLSTALSSEQQVILEAIARETTLQAVRDRLPSTLGQKASASSLPVVFSSEQQTIIDAIAKEGTAVTGETLETGGSRVLGWLSSVRKAITDFRTALLGVASGATDSGNPVKVGGVYTATTPTLTNGQRGNLQLSVRSNLLIDTIDYVSSPTNIQSVDTVSTTSTGQDNQTIIRGNPTNNSFASYASSGNSSFAILIENQPTGTPFVGTLQIERSLDGTIWTAISAFVAGSAYTRSQITAEAVLHGNCSSSQFLRVRAIAWTSGIARITFLAGQGTGTITIGNPIRLYDMVSNAQANIKPSNTNWAITDTALVVTTRDLPIELTGTGSSLNADVIPSTNVSGYQSFALQLTQSAFAGSVSIQGSNDNTNWVNIPYQQTTNTSANTGAISNIGLYEGKLNYKHFRCRITSYTSGSVTLTVIVNKFPIAFNGINNTSFQISSGSITVAGVSSKAQIYVTGTISSSGDNTIISAPGAGNRIYITAITVQLEASTATTVLFKSAATTFRRILCQNQGDGISLQYSPGFEIRLGLNEAFILNLSGANSVGYSVEYYIA